MRLLGVSHRRREQRFAPPLGAEDGVAGGGVGFLASGAREVEHQRFECGGVGVRKAGVKGLQPLVEGAPPVDELVGQRGMNCKPNASGDDTRVRGVSAIGRG